LAFTRAVAEVEEVMSKTDVKKLEQRLGVILTDPLTLEDLAITGDDLIKLGVPQGPKIGHILQKLLDIITDYPPKNTWSQLISYAKELVGLP
jgi:tRNA nucleotidyltransferase (CCA-adding enzyme)